MSNKTLSEIRCTLLDCISGLRLVEQVDEAATKVDVLQSAARLVRDALEQINGELEQIEASDTLWKNIVQETD